MLYAAHGLAQAQAVRVVSIAVVQAGAAVHRAHQAAAQLPGEGGSVIPGGGVADSVVGDALAVVGSQQILPPGITIAVLGGRPVYALDGDKAVHAVIGILDRLAVGVAHGEAVAVAVVSVADGIAIGLGDGEQAAPVIILVLGQNLSFLFQSCHFLKSFSSGNSGSNSGLFTRI